MKDCVGQELKIGDKVVCSDMKYADLLIGEIIGFTPKKARVRYVRSEYGAAYGCSGQHEQLKETYQIFKYSEKEVATIPNAKKYYSPEEVDQLTTEQLADNAIWDRVRESMAKWNEKEMVGEK